MAYPTGANAHIDRPLSNFAVSAFNDSRAGFIGQQLFPLVRVGKQSDLYYTLEKDAFLREYDALRAPKTQARRIEFTVSSGAFYAHNYALLGELALEDIANADDPINLRQNQVRLVTGGLARAEEIRIANIVSSASNAGSGFTPGSNEHWTDVNTVDIIAQVQTGQAFIRMQSGFTPNTMVVDWDTAQAMKRNLGIVSRLRIKNGEANMDDLRSAFGIDNILVGAGVKNVAPEGLPASMTNIWGNMVWLGYVGPNTGLQSMVPGIRFEWSPDIYPANMGVMVSRKNEAGSPHVEHIEVGHYQDERVVAKELSYVIYGPRNV